MMNIAIPAENPGAFANVFTNGLDPATADLTEGSPSAFVSTTGAADPTLDQWLANPLTAASQGAAGAAVSALMGTGAPSGPAPAAGQPGWFAAQPWYVRWGFGLAAVGLLLIGVLGLVLPAAEKAAPAAAAAA